MTVYGYGWRGDLWWPVIPIALRGRRGTHRFLGLVDSGADVTMIPRWMADRVGIVPVGHLSATVRGVGGEAELEEAWCDLTLLSPQGRRAAYSFGMVHIDVIEDKELRVALLGRDHVFDAHRVLFDQPALELHLMPRGRRASAAS